MRYSFYFLILLSFFLVLILLRHYRYGDDSRSFSPINEKKDVVFFEGFKFDESISKLVYVASLLLTLSLIFGMMKGILSLFLLGGGSHHPIVPPGDFFPIFCFAALAPPFMGFERRLNEREFFNERIEGRINPFPIDNTPFFFRLSGPGSNLSRIDYSPKFPTSDYLQKVQLFR